MSHPSLESVYVVRGVITAEIDKVSFDVKAGENISFDARQSHRYLNRGTEEAEIIMSITPPVP
jgi:quercetin dioxygenase-like cupin family protein